MAGHSKWANIKHKKAKEDAARGKIFTKLIKEITICARESGPLDGNPRLRTLVEKAKFANMPKENIERAIKKGTGELPGVSYEQCFYEGYTPGGVAVIVEVLTDNKNRAVAELRHVFSKKGGNLAEHGAVSWMFKNKGVIRATGTSISEDDLMEKLLDFDVENIEHSDGLFSVFCDPKALDTVKKAIEETELKIESAEIEQVTDNKADISEENQHRAFEFLEALEALEDVQNIYSNLS